MGRMRRIGAGLLAAVLFLNIVAACIPQRAQADPVALAMTYAEYQAALAAAGLTYGGKTYADLKSEQGVTDRELAVLKSGMLSYGILDTIDGSDITVGQLYATVVGMKARETWSAIQAGALGMYEYGSYAWARLMLWGSALFSFQAAASGSATWPGVTSAVYPGGRVPSAAQLQTPIQQGYWGGADATIAAKCNALMLMIQAAALDPHGAPVWVSAWNSTVAPYTTHVTVRATAGGSTADVALQINSGTNWSWRTNSQAAAIALAAIYDQVVGVPGTLPADPRVDPMPFDPDMPEDPFPGDQNGTPQGPHLQPIPIPWIGDTGGTGTNPPGSPADTPDAPVPYTPPLGTPEIPIPPGLPPAPGEAIRDAADDLANTIPDTFGWLRDPLVAIMRWLADLMDWLAGVWATISGWVAGLFWPGAAGMGALWTAQWTALNTAASTRWPFAIGTLFSQLWDVLLSPATGSHAVTLQMTIPVGQGVTLSQNLGDWFEPVQSWRWLGVGLAYLGLAVALVVSLRPRVVT